MRLWKITRRSSPSEIAKDTKSPGEFDVLPRPHRAILIMQIFRGRSVASAARVFEKARRKLLPTVVRQVRARRLRLRRRPVSGREAGISLSAPRNIPSRLKSRRRAERNGVRCRARSTAVACAKLFIARTYFAAPSARDAHFPGDGDASGQLSL